MEKNKNVRKGKDLFTSYDNIVYYSIQNTSDDEMFKVADWILAGKPVIANFDKVVGDSRCNDVLSFISGIVYAKKGRVYELSKILFLFAKAEEYEDGSLEQYIREAKY